MNRFPIDDSEEEARAVDAYGDPRITMSDQVKDVVKVVGDCTDYKGYNLRNLGQEKHVSRDISPFQFTCRVIGTTLLIMVAVIVLWLIFPDGTMQ